jgi:UDP-N-acetylmuramoyl-tripeptide--D-alanyl-D-alanine ligase
MDYLKQLAKQILRWEARLVLKRYRPKIIAITGSVGKTLAKEAVYLTLSKKLFIRKSEKSFTAELGVPLTIIGSP